MTELLKDAYNPKNFQAEGYKVIDQLAAYLQSNMIEKTDQEYVIERAAQC